MLLLCGEKQREIIGKQEESSKSTFFSWSPLDKGKSTSVAHKTKVIPLSNIHSPWTSSGKYLIEVEVLSEILRNDDFYVYGDSGKQ